MIQAIPHADQAEVVDVSSFASDETLADDLMFYMVLKWQNQQEHDPWLPVFSGVRLDDVTVPRNPKYESTYHSGLVALVDGVGDSLGPDTIACATEIEQPTGGCVDGDQVLVAAGRSIEVFDGQTLAHQHLETITNDTAFSRLHSVQVLGDTLLTAVSPYDTILEIDRKGIIRDSIQLWDWEDGGWNENSLAQRFWFGEGPEGAIVDPEPNRLFESPPPGLVIITNASYNGYKGIPTSLVPVRINSVYQEGDQTLATSFNRGQVFVVDQDGPRVVLEGMNRPHGIVPVESKFGRYRVTDTCNERLIFTDDNFTPTTSFDFTRIDGRKEEIEDARWLQNVAEFANGVFAAVLQVHCKIVFFDPENQTRHEVPFDQNWGVADLIPAY